MVLVKCHFVRNHNSLMKVNKSNTVYSVSERRIYVYTTFLVLQITSFLGDRVSCESYPPAGILSN